jgi:hypothetical protein
MISRPGVCTPTLHQDTVDPGVDLSYHKIPEQRSLRGGHLQVVTQAVHLTGTVAGGAPPHAASADQAPMLFSLLRTLGLDDR